jgi:hypothetical protein
MAKKTCPTCGCVISSGGYETGGVVFCGEDCAKNTKGSSCGCGCGGKKKPEAKPKGKCKK